MSAAVPNRKKPDAAQRVEFKILMKLWTYEPQLPSYILQV